MLVSYTITFAGILAFLLPVILAVILGWRFWPRHLFTIAGGFFGSIVSHFAVFLYLQFFADPLRALVFGFPGLFLMAIHLGLFMNVSEASHQIVVSPLPGLFHVLGSIPIIVIVIWVGVYSGIGSIIDFRRRRHTKVEGTPNPVLGSTRKRLG